MTLSKACHAAAAVLVTLVAGAADAGAQSTLGGLSPAFSTGQLGATIGSLPFDARQKAVSAITRFGIPAADVPHLRVDRTGALYYADPARAAPHPFDAAAARRSTVNIDRTKVFKLHSRKGAANVVYLNFRGGTVTGTAWNDSAGVATFQMLAYSEDGDRSNVSQAEANTIAEVWARMAEDYAPFGVDVTTEKPGSFGPNVAHVMFTPRTDKNGNAIYPSFVGGVAYVGVFGLSNFTYYQPALVFPEGVGGAKGLTEAGSHELGHNLGLSHDGTSTEGYYRGHGTGNASWGPIMGVGYYTSVTQWSKGEYADANNQQDDIQIISDSLGFRRDDHAATKAGATKLVVSSSGKVSSFTPQKDPLGKKSKKNRGVIERRKDVDVFVVKLSRRGTIDLSVTPSWKDDFVTAARGSNLDIRADLFRASGSGGPKDYGTLVASSNSKSDTNARVNATVGKGTYYLVISGVGPGDVLGTGYNDYGSLGQYFISGKVPRP
jgi:hypothetical protein